MDPSAVHFFHLLQFLSLEPGDQIAYCADHIPDDASASLTTSSDSDDKQYDHYWTERMGGGPLDRFYAEYCDYMQMFTNRDEDLPPDDEALLADIESKLEAMVHHPENEGVYNRYWGKNQLRSTAWEELRELSRQALRALHLESRIPEEPFEDLLYLD